MDQAPQESERLDENTAEFTPISSAHEQLEEAAAQARDHYDDNEHQPVKQRRFRVAARASVVRHTKHGGSASEPTRTAEKEPRVPARPRSSRRRRIETSSQEQVTETSGGTRSPGRRRFYPRRGAWWRHTALLSFLFPILLLAIAYMIQGFWPIADTSPLTIDLYHQYASYISELRTKILSGESLLYSWRTGLGNNFYATYAYYAASPLNLLLVLFPAHYITEAVTVLTLLKVGLIGLTTAFMFRYAFCPEGRRTIAARKATRVRRRDEVATDRIIVALSTAFALSGFVLAYSWDIMWLDVIYLLPLIVLGLNRMIAQNKFLLYTITLALAIFTNYYIALFVCIFLFFYFFVAYFSYKAQRLTPLRRPALHFLKKLLFFGGFSILAAGIVAILAVPTFLALQNTSAAGDVMPKTAEFRFTFFEFLSRQLIAMQPSIRSGLPNIYSGILVFAFVPLYIFARSIPAKEKAWHLALLAFLYLSFNSNILDFFWHGMHYPNQLPYRYSFLYSFLLIIICFRALTSLREYSHRMIVSALGLGIIMTILAQQLLPDDVSHTTTYITLFFFVVYVGVFSLLRKRGNFRLMATILMIIVLGELALNTVLTIHHLGSNENYTSRSRFVGDIPQVKEAIDFVEGQDSGFYRLELRPQKTTNDGALYDYPGFTTFSSTARETTAKMMRNLGYHGNNINSYKYMGSTLVMDSLFDIRYRIYKDSSVYNPYYREIYTDDALHAYRLDTAITPGFVANSGVELWSLHASSPFTTQNQLVSRAMGIRDIFEHQELDEISRTNLRLLSGTAKDGYDYTPEDKNSETKLTMEFIMPEDGMAYFFVKATATTQVKTTAYGVEGVEDIENDDSVVANASPIPVPDVEPPVETTSGSVAHESRSIRRPEIIEIGYRQAGERVRIELSAKNDAAKDLDVFAAMLDDEAFREMGRELQARQLVIDAFDERTLEGHYTANADQGRVFLSIPYDEGWELLIDGEPAPLSDIADEGLLSFATEPGDHRFVLRYTPVGMNIGVYISILSIILFVIINLLKRVIVIRRERATRELPGGSATGPRVFDAEPADDTRLATAEDLARLREVRAKRSTKEDDLPVSRSGRNDEIEFMKLSSDEGDGYMEVRRFDARGHDADPKTFDVFEDETEAEVLRIIHHADQVKKSDADSTTEKDKKDTSENNGE